MAQLHDQMLETARFLLNAKSPHGAAGLRRAASTAYYSLFLRLSALCARAISRSRPKSPSYLTAFRILDHGSTREALSKEGEFKSSIGEPFSRLQEARYWSDYNLASHPVISEANAGKRFSRGEALELVDVAADAIRAIDSLGASARQRLVVLLVARLRRQSRP